MIAIAHSWLGPIKPSSSPHELCMRAGRCADVPPAALAVPPGPDQWSLDPCWLIVFSSALMISWFQACVPVSFCAGGMLISYPRGGCCDAVLCQDQKRIDLVSFFTKGFLILCSDMTRMLHKSNKSTQVLKWERSYSAAKVQIEPESSFASKMAFMRVWKGVNVCKPLLELFFLPHLLSAEKPLWGWN